MSSGVLEGARLDGGFLAGVDLGDLRLVGLEVGRAHGGFHAHARSRLVDGVDRLVGEQARGQVAGRERYGGAEGLVGELHVVVLLVTGSDAAEYLDGFVDGGFVHEDGLEPALEGGVLLDGLMVFLHRGGAHDLQFAAREGGLEDVRGVHRAFGAAGAHERVDLVEEEDDVADELHLLDELLETFLELSAVLRAGDDARHVERDDAFVAHAFGDVAEGDGLREALHHGGLPHAGLADQHGVVLRAAGEDLDDAYELLLASDDGVELALAREGGEVASEDVERRGLAFLRGLRLAVGGGSFVLFAFGGLVRRGFVGKGLVVHLRLGLCEGFGREAVSGEDLRGHGLSFGEDGEDDVLGAHGRGLEAPRLEFGEFEDLARARRDGDFAAHAHVFAVSDHLLELEAEFVRVDVQRAEPPAGAAVRDGEDGTEQVLGADVGMVVAAGGGFCAVEGLVCVWCVVVVHERMSNAKSLRRTFEK